MADSTGHLPTTGSGASRALVSAVTDWFARTLDAPEQARREWHGDGVALLPLGKKFDAVRLPDALVHAAVGSTEPGETAVLLERFLRGPVIHDSRTMGGIYYALMRPVARVQWRHQDIAPRLGVNNYLGVPTLARTALPGPYWVVLPRFEGDLCEPSAVEGLVTAGSAVLSGTEQ